MNILFLTPDYPNKYRASFEFVKQLVDAIANRGNNCYVISPFSVTREKRFWRGKESVSMENGGTVTIARPNHLSFSNKHIGNFHPTAFFRKKAINRALRKMDFKPDVAYGHFWNCGWSLYEYASQNKIPLFVATGESEIARLFSITPDKKPFYDYVNGVICVSSKNMKESIDLGLTIKEKCLLAPNSINNQLFRLMDKGLCRKKLGLPQDAYIVVFLGWFKHIKGPERVSRAISLINDGEKVYSIFIGAGSEETPQCENILFKGRLLHQEVPEYLNAADAFVLPTLNEGCCNSIVEAMACGLPIISSDLPFNWDILSESNSIMIDPNNIEEIANAIVRLRDDKDKRISLAQGSIESAKELTIDKRAEKIELFIRERIKKQ